MGAAVFIGLRALNSSASDTKSMYEHNIVALEKLLPAQEHILLSGIQTTEALLAEDDEQAVQLGEESRHSLEVGLEELHELGTVLLDPASIALVEEAEHDIAELQEAREEIFALLAAGDHEGRDRSQRNTASMAPSLRASLRRPSWMTSRP